MNYCTASYTCLVLVSKVVYKRKKSSKCTVDITDAFVDITEL